MASIRKAVPSDAAMIARLHVQTWREAYKHLLPQAELDAQTLERRTALWVRVLEAGHTVFVADELGFAQIARQREPYYDALGYPQELYCLYVLRRAYGSGLALNLFMAATKVTAPPMTACVIKGNDRALAFYRKTGAKVLETRSEMIGVTPITEHVLGWDKPIRR